MYSADVSLVPPYSFERLLRRLQTHPDPQLRVDAEAGRLIRGLRFGQKAVLVAFDFTGSTEEPALRVQWDAELTQHEQALLLQTARHLFSADLDLAPLYQLMNQDQHLQPLVSYFRGLRYMLAPDLFQAMIINIIGQQITLSFANTLTERLLQLAGDRLVDREGTTYLVFPTPEAVARLSVETLRALQFSQRKAEYIIDFAQAVVEQRIDLERLWQLTDEEAIAYLSTQRGVGRWTVECLLMFGMGRPDLLPVADIGLRNGIQLVYGLTEKPTQAEMRRLGAAWSPWRSYVSLYLWEAVGAVRRKEPFAPYPLGS